MSEHATRHVLIRYTVIIVAVITILCLIPVAVAQSVGPNSTVIAVSDSDGSTADIDKIVEESEGTGAEIVVVTPDESERTKGYSSETASAAAGSPDTKEGDIIRDTDGDLLAEEALRGVELMEPLVEDALSSVKEDRDILVIASGNGAGAAGNVLEKIAFDEGPVSADRILGHVLIGDPYRTGSASAQSAAREDYRQIDFKDDISKSSVGFPEESEGVSELPEPDEGSEADQLLADSLRDSEDDSNDGVDRVGENNSREESDALSDPYASGDRYSDLAEMNGREVIPRWQHEYGSDPEDNPNQAEIVPREESEGYKEHGGAEHQEEMEKPLDSGSSSSDGSSSDAADAERDAAENGREVEDNYVPDDWTPGNGSDGADVQEARAADPGANNGEGAMGDGEIWAFENDGRANSERALTSASTSGSVTTPGTGVLGQRERGFGELEDSTLSICSTQDSRCASNGMPTLLVQVLTGDLQKTPELAHSVLRGLIAIGRLISNVDKQEIAQLASESTKCGASIATVTAAGGAGVAAVSSGVLAPAAVPAVAGAAVAAGGAAQSCGRAAESSLRVAADIYRLYKSDPDLIHAAELISLIDPDSENGQLILSKLPVEFQAPPVMEMLRRISKVGYALDNIRYDVYLDQMADGAGQISDLNPVGLANLLAVSLSLTDALAKAVFDVDQTMFGTFAAGLGGAVGQSSMANMLGSQIGQGLTQAGADYDRSTGGNTMSGGGGRPSPATGGSRSGGGNSATEGGLDVDSKYAERYDYNEMDVGDGMTATEFAAGYALDALKT